jgi:hypothetical protein
MLLDLCMLVLVVTKAGRRLPQVFQALTKYCSLLQEATFHAVCTATITWLLLLLHGAAFYFQ